MRAQKLICTLGIFGVVAVGQAATTHYYFINDSEHTVYASWQHSNVVIVPPWKKVLLASDKKDQGQYQLALSHHQDNLQQAPLQIHLQTNKNYQDQTALSLQQVNGQQAFALKHSDRYKPSSLFKSVDQVQINSSDAFAFDASSYHLYQSDIQINNVFSPAREIDLTLQQQQPYFQRDDHNPNKMTVLTYNVQLWDDFSSVGGMRLNQPTRRAQLIPPRIAGYDVVIAEELMSENGLQGRRKIFAEAMKKNGYPYQYGPIPRALGISGGVMIFSHWPLSMQQQLKFPSNGLTGVDALSNKGILYASMNKLGKTYHLFATHTQADEPADKHSSDVKAREADFQSLVNWYHKLNIPVNEPVIVAGDLNVNNMQGQEYQATIGQLTQKPQVWENQATMPYASNPAINLMNTDDHPEMVDYVLMLGQPLIAPLALNKHSRVRVIRAPEIAEMYAGGDALNASKKPFAALDLSDHFAYEVKFTLQP